MKEWSKSVNQIKEHLDHSISAKEATNDNHGCFALLAAANDISNAGKATAHRLAEVDVILTRIDSLQHELAGAEQRVVDIAAKIHSPKHNLSGSNTSLRSNISETEASSVETVHDQLKVSCLLNLLIGSDYRPCIESNKVMLVMLHSLVFYSGDFLHLHNVVFFRFTRLISVDPGLV